MVAVVNNYTNSSNQAPAGLGYDGVVRVSVAGFYGTGVLLAGGHAILTAAHLFSHGSTLTTVQFETVKGKESLTSSAVTVDPSYQTSTENHDLALVWLTGNAPVEADRYTLYRQTDEIGKTATLVGYGVPGTGQTGIQPELGSSRLKAENQFDADAASLKSALGSAMGWSPSSVQLVADFDNGMVSQDALGLLMNQSGLGLGADEGMTTSGDSGGPAFISGKVAGIASYTAVLTKSGATPDIDDVSNSSFGELSFWQRISSSQQWIDQSLRAHYEGAPTKPSEVQKTVVEGNSGTVTIWFLVSFSSPARGGESVHFETKDGSAKAGIDYVAVNDTLRFYLGEDHIAIPVEVIGNTRIEGDRVFSLVVTDPVGGVFAGGVSELTATRTILDDDAPVTVVGVAHL